METFEGLHARLHEKVYRRARTIVRNEADAEDVAQLAWLKVARCLPSFRGESKVSTWVYALTTTTALDWLRGEQRQKCDTRRNMPLAAADGVPSPQVSPCEAALFSDRIRRAEAIMARLPPLYQASFAAHLRGETYVEAAAAQGIPVSTVKTRVWRSRAIVRAALDKPKSMLHF